MKDDGLRCFQCSKSYGKNHALRDVSLSVMPGEIVGLVGPNGAGKTTLLHSIVGLVRMSSGRITLNGQDIQKPSTKMHVGFMPDNLPRPQHLTARELCRLTCRLYQQPFDISCFEALAEEYEIEQRCDEGLSSLSHGMSRKVDLIAALLTNPSLLILDEPFSGLDPGMVDVLQKSVHHAARQGTSVLLSSHDLELVEDIADRIVVLSRGVVAYDGTIDVLRAREGSDLRDAFRKLTHGKGNGNEEVISQ